MSKPEDIIMEMFGYKGESQGGRNDDYQRKR
jgi:hypothetical protein